MVGDLQNENSCTALQRNNNHQTKTGMLNKPFTNYDQIAILQKLENNNIELALRFQNHNQFLAFEELSKRTHTTPEQNARSALNFMEFSQVEALQILQNEDLALKFKTPFSLDVLKKIGIDNVELALKFKYYVQYEVLKLVGPNLALQITTYPQLHTLTNLGSHCFDEALTATAGDLAEINFLSDVCSTRLAENHLKVAGQSSETSEQEL